MLLVLVLAGEFKLLLVEALPVVLVLVGQIVAEQDYALDQQQGEGEAQDGLVELGYVDVLHLQCLCI